ncbi:MAG: hypothetical protein AB1416_02170 [Actinomycetota bacterium]
MATLGAQGGAVGIVVAAVAGLLISSRLMTVIWYHAPLIVALLVWPVLAASVWAGIVVIFGRWRALPVAAASGGLVCAGLVAAADEYGNGLLLVLGIWAGGAAVIVSSAYVALRMGGRRELRGAPSAAGRFTAVGAVVLVGAVAPWVTWDVALGGRPVAFSREGWRDGVRTDTPTAMAETLVRRRSLAGRERSEVAALLGAPDVMPSRVNGWDVGYRLGLDDDLLGVDVLWLEIDFGEDGLVRQYEVAGD